MSKETQTAAEQTSAATTAAGSANPIPARNSGESNLDYMVRVAMSQEGVSESVQDNQNPYSTAVEAWCVHFVSWCANQASFTLPGTATASTSTMKGNYDAAGKLGNAKTYLPKKGDLVFYSGHTAIVIADDTANKKLWTIDGNTWNSVEPDYVSHFDGVYFRSRTYTISNGERTYSKAVVGFGKNGGTSTGAVPTVTKYN
jgi:hypothetical protein